MSDLKLFCIDGQKAAEVHGTSMALEKSLQTLIEQNLEALLGVRFLASEFTTDREHGGRMDTLGIDENGCPVIIEYKRSANMNVINQGLFYLDWLVTHRGNFEMLVLKELGADAAQSVEWSSPRLICIAGDFSKYDEHAIKQINRNIELIRYVNFENGMLLLDQINAVSVSEKYSEVQSDIVPPATRTRHTTVSEHLERADDKLRSLFENLSDHLQGYGEDVQMRTLQSYFAFKRIKNFACVEIRNQEQKLLAFVKVDPASIELENGFTRDVRNIGHFGTGDLEITIRSPEDLERAERFFKRSYENA